MTRISSPTSGNFNISVSYADPGHITQNHSAAVLLIFHTDAETDLNFCTAHLHKVREWLWHSKCQSQSP